MRAVGYGNVRRYLRGDRSEKRRLRQKRKQGESRAIDDANLSRVDVDSWHSNRPPSKVKMMKKLFKKILCPIDFDENSYFALDLARDLAQDTDSTIYLLHVVSVSPVAESGVLVEPYAISERDARTKLGRIAADHLEGKVDYKIITRIGSPADLVNQAVAELGVDSIVIATHGRRGIARLLLGSVAEKVVREAPCPVLAVKGPV